MEKRKFERVSKKFVIRCCSSNDSKQIQHEVLSDDIGIGGVRVGLAEEMPVGQRIKLSIRKLTDSEWSPEIDGIVAWQKSNVNQLPETKTTGICFSSDQILINNYLTQSIIKEAENHTDLRTFRESLPHTSEIQIKPAYDGSKATYKLLRFFGWGPLNNLGYFQFPSPLEFLNLITSFMLGKILFLLPEAQQRLIVNSIKLLNVKKGDKILDIACGKGMSSFILSSLYPEAMVTGIDLIPSNINAASALYGGAPNLRFSVGNAMDLNVGDSTANKIMCVEAAFHFSDRAQFIKESYRALKPSGRLVVVDFMWTRDDTRLSSENKYARLAKSEWRWDDFFSITDYRKAALEAGFKIQAEHDWSAWVTGPLAYTFKTVALVGNTSLGRAILSYFNPLLRSLSKSEWEHLLESAWAHVNVGKCIKYVALVLTK